jgi:hypothetical protein
VFFFTGKGSVGMGHKAETTGGRRRLEKLDYLVAQQAALVAELERRGLDGHLASDLLRLVRIARDTIDESERIIAGMCARQARRGPRAAPLGGDQGPKRTCEAREAFHANELAAFLHYVVEDADRLNSEAAQLLRLAILSLKEGRLASPISQSQTLH